MLCLYYANITTIPNLTTPELSSKLASCENIHQRSYWQILLSVSFNPNKKAKEYASFLDVTKSKIYKVVELYNKEGKDFTAALNWGGRRNTTSHMSIEDDETKMMAELKIKANEGKILVAKLFVKLLKRSW